MQEFVPLKMRPNLSAAGSKELYKNNEFLITLVPGLPEKDTGADCPFLPGFMNPDWGSPEKIFNFL